MCGRLPHPCEKGGADTGPSPVDRRKTGSKHHLICDGRGTPLKVITTAANVNDVTQTLALVDGIPPVAGRAGRPRRRPDSLLGDKGYDSNPNREELRKRRVRKDEAQAAFGHGDAGGSEAEELARLRAENTRLLKAEKEWHLEREILRRAAAYFAREVK